MRGVLDMLTVRLVAAFLAISIAGVPELFAPPDAPAGHRCQCPIREGRHECDCPLCHAEAARHAAEAAARPGGHADHDAAVVGAAPAAKVPPCHLALAKKTAVKEREAAARRAAAGPVISSTCGTDDRRLRPPPAVEFFTMPSAPVLELVVTVARLGAERADRLASTLEPETPPPRRASPAAA
ncbi:MAG: hypothetical protein IPO09_20210 [Anaeromyxobacter sp.]|nr:hypothetical protein [Anaeromyxobacter sp.]MBL0274885.1 hypothetical protein [Anaeromyxobacter sp.]